MTVRREVFQSCRKIKNPLTFVFMWHKWSSPGLSLTCSSDVIMMIMQEARKAVIDMICGGTLGLVSLTKYSKRTDGFLSSATEDLNALLVKNCS